jgi:hypothetical protein
MCSGPSNSTSDVFSYNPTEVNTTNSEPELVQLLRDFENNYYDKALLESILAGPLSSDSPCEASTSYQAALRIWILHRFSKSSIVKKINIKHLNEKYRFTAHNN